MNEPKVASVLEEMRANTNKTVAKIDHFLGAHGMDSGIFSMEGVGAGLTMVSGATAIFVSDQIINKHPFANLIENPYIQVGFLGTFAVGATLIAFSRLYQKFRGEQVTYEKEIASTLHDPVQVIGMTGMPQTIARKSVYEALDKGSFYQKYHSVITQENRQDVASMPANVKEYIALGMKEATPEKVEKYERALGKVIAMDGKKNAVNKVGGLRENFAEVNDYMYKKAPK